MVHRCLSSKFLTAGDQADTMSGPVQKDGSDLVQIDPASALAAVPGSRTAIAQGPVLDVAVLANGRLTSHVGFLYLGGT